MKGNHHDARICESITDIEVEDYHGNLYQEFSKLDAGKVDPARREKLQSLGIKIAENLSRACEGHGQYFTINLKTKEGLDAGSALISLDKAAKFLLEMIACSPETSLAIGAAFDEYDETEKQSK
jgi:hypothetical protein